MADDNIPKKSVYIDRIARAIHDERIFVINSDTPDEVLFDNTTQSNQTRYRQLATAAIAAMREPPALDDPYAIGYFPNCDPREVWRGYIDFILKHHSRAAEE